MLWYKAAIENVLDNPPYGTGPSLQSMEYIRSGPGLPKDASQWPLEVLEREEKRTARKIEALGDWIIENIDLLRKYRLKYDALNDLMKRFQRRLQKIREIKEERS